MVKSDVFVHSYVVKDDPWKKGSWQGINGVDCLWSKSDSFCFVGDFLDLERNV